MVFAGVFLTFVVSDVFGFCRLSFLIVASDICHFWPPTFVVPTFVVLTIFIPAFSVLMFVGISYFSYQCIVSNDIWRRGGRRGGDRIEIAPRILPNIINETLRSRGRVGCGWRGGSEGRVGSSPPLSNGPDWKWVTGQKLLNILWPQPNGPFLGCYCSFN